MNPSDSVRWIGAAPTWLSQTPAMGSATNPANNTLIGDTGQLAFGYYDIFAYFVCNAALTTSNAWFEHRNAANSATIYGEAMLCFAQEIIRPVLLGIKVQVNERFRFYVYTGFTGSLYTSLYAIQRA
jgi:hypothetical protein